MDEYDFYYSEKMHGKLVQLGDVIGFWENFAQIGNKIVQFTEMVPVGEQPLVKYTDMEYLGRGVFHHNILTKQPKPCRDSVQSITVAIAALHKVLIEDEQAATEEWPETIED